MPDSKTLLNDAKKILDRRRGDPMAWTDQAKAVQGDLSSYEKALIEYKKHRQILTVSLNALKSSAKSAKENLKELNDGLSNLNKNKPVFVSPADSKTYKQHQTDFTNLIKNSMAAAKKLDDLQRAVEAALK